MNANAYLSLVKGLSEKTRLRFSLASITAATFLAVEVTCHSGDPVYASVVTWALAAIVNGADSKSFQVSGAWSGVWGVWVEELLVSRRGARDCSGELSTERSAERSVVVGTRGGAAGWYGRSCSRS